MRLTQIRLVSQIFFFALFLLFVIVTDLRYLQGWPVSLFLEMDPLVGLATAITTHEIYLGLIWGLVLLIPTLLLGRIFCNWICPYGILHHFIGWAFGGKNVKQRIEANRYRALYSLKYVILIVMMISACFGSLQIGLLDPICLLFRSFTSAVLPGVNQLRPATIYVQQHDYVGAWVIGFMLLFLVGMNAVIPRFFCRVLCPLGATLGFLSRFALWRIERNPHKCVDCDLCVANCEGAADPHTNLRKSECFVCFNCLDDCPTDAIAFKFLPPKRHEVALPDLSRRRLAWAGAIGLLFYPFTRSSGASTKNYSPKAIRPPGSVEENDFLRRCIKCDQCIRVCPTGVLQPAAFETGVEGIWTPILNMKMGWCELNCTLCGQVCPTGAIQRITIEEKTGVGEFTQQGPVRLGTAFYDHGRCLPWSMETPCVVCEEVCPTSPKAIYSREASFVKRDGNPITLRQPYVEPALCIGCGICEHECPVKDSAAIYVTAIGETRSKERRLLMDGGVTSAVKELTTIQR